MRRVLEIRLYDPCAECSVCGAETVSRWGIPVYEDYILRNDEEGEWGGAPACEVCYAIHQAGNIDLLYRIRAEAARARVRKLDDLKESK
jgi:hypothetical protein